MPEGSVSAVTTLDHQAQRGLHRGPGPAHRAGGGAQADRRRCRRAGQSLDTVPQVAADPAHHRPQHPDLGRQQRAGAPQGEVQGGASRGPEGPGPDRPGPEGEGGAGHDQIVDGLRAELRAAPEARGRAARRPSTPRRPRPPARAARAAELDALQEGGGLGQEPLRGPAAEAQRDRHRRLHPQQQRERRGARAAARARPSGPTRSGSPAVACLLGLLLGRRPRARARLPRQHDQGPGGDRALPAPRPAGRRAALRRGQRPPRDRGLPEPAHRAHLRAQGRARPGRARHRHRAPGRQDHDAREHRQAAGLLGREDGRASTSTCAAPSSTAAWA